MKAPELTDLAVAWLREQHPDAYVTTELSVAEWGGASVDVAAITATEIVGIEIKGEGDSPSRLELQGFTYSRVCRRMWLLVTPDGTLAERCEKKRPAGWGVLKVEDGKITPAIRYQTKNHTEHRTPAESQRLCAMQMCETLWRDELAHICRKRPDIHWPGGRPNVTTLRNAVVNSLPVPKIHEAMIERLRARSWGDKVVHPPTLDPDACIHCLGTGAWPGTAAMTEYERRRFEGMACGHCRGTGESRP